MGFHRVLPPLERDGRWYSLMVTEMPVSRDVTLYMKIYADRELKRLLDEQTLTIPYQCRDVISALIDNTLSSLLVAQSE